MKQAEEGIEKLRKYVDSIIIIPNERLLEIAEEKLGVFESFAYVDDILRQAIQGISDIINKTGYINVDFADVKVVMQNSGNAVMGIGHGAGQNKVEKALDMCLKNPLLNVDIEGAKGILVNVTGSKDLTIVDYSKIMSTITKKAHTEARIIVGYLYDESLQDSVTITLIATNFDENKKLKSNKIESNIKENRVKLVEDNMNFDIEDSFLNFKSISKSDKFDITIDDISNFDEDIPAIMRKR